MPLHDLFANKKTVSPSSHFSSDKTIHIFEEKKVKQRCMKREDQMNQRRQER